MSGTVNNSKEGSSLQGPVEDVQRELKYLKSQIEKIFLQLNPLGCLTDLSLARKRFGQSGDFSQGGVSVTVDALSPEERLRELEMMPPQTVLNSIAEYINSQDLTPARKKAIERTFVSKDEFNKFKTAVANDEDRKAQFSDMSKQIRAVNSKQNDIEADQHNIQTEIMNVRGELRAKASMIKIE